MLILAKIKSWFKKQPPQPSIQKQKDRKDKKISYAALLKALEKKQEVNLVEPYQPPPGVLPRGQENKILAMDDTPYNYVNSAYVSNYFPGYQYLAQLAQLPEYRKMSEVIAKEMTRKWIKIQATDDKEEKVKRLEDCLKNYKIESLFREAAEQDGLFGRSQIYIDVEKPSGGIASEDYEELASPLFLSSKKIKKGGLKSFRIIEPVWTYPGEYNSSDPLLPNFYKPGVWYVMGKTIHASRMLTFIGREVPDLLKASYNFGGLSMSQMAQPYINNFLRTRDSISDLVHSFSVNGIATNMGATLSGLDDSQFIDRARLFTDLRDNRGLMMLDKDSEEFFQFNTPLSGLDALQAQSQEHMSAVSSIPLVKLLGITPSGLNASAEGEIQVFYDDIHAMQEKLFRDPLKKILDIIQLSEFGDIDEDITFEFENLYGADEVEEAGIRKSDAETDAVLVTSGIISPDEARERLVGNPESGYNNLDLNAEIELPGEQEESQSAMD
jgi:hypothetical protein